MYYLSDITGGKVGSIIINLPSEDYIGYLGWDRADKEREGVFVDTLPECNVPALHNAELCIDSDRQPHYNYVPLQLDKAREIRTSEINSACTCAIHAGVDVETTQGVEHFSLTENDQINLSSVYQQAQSGSPAVLYHADGKLCRMFTAAEITAIMTAATMHKTYHTTYCNHLHVWINRCDSVDELQTISYGVALPEDLQANLDGVLGAIQSE